MAAQKQNRGIIRAVAEFLRLVAPDETITRAIDRWTLDDAIRDQLNEKGYRVSDIFVDGPDQFAIAYKVTSMDEYGYPEIDRTLLYQFPVTNDGVNVTLGEPVQVKQMFVAVERSAGATPGLVIYRDAQGVARFFATASSAVINRDKQIDSTALYQSMIANTEKHGMPYLTLFHKGKQRKVGEITAITRLGPLYVGGGKFDSGELAEAVIRAVEKEPDYYGISIGFIPTAPPKKERIGGADVMIYTEGINEEWSILPEKRACAWFTNIKVERTMTAEFQEFMKTKIFPDNPALAEKYAADTEQRAESITNSGAVQRAATDAAATETAATTATDAKPAVTPPVEPAKPADLHFELTPDAITAIATALAETDTFKALATGVTRSAGDLVTVATEVKSVSDKLAGFETRLVALERPELEKQRAWQAETPRGAGRVIIGLPPSQTRAAEKDSTELEKLPVAPGNPLSGMEF